MSNNKSTLNLRRLLAQGKLVTSFLLKKWLLIVIVVVIGSVLGFAYAFFKKPTYTGELTFVLSSGSSESSLYSLASQFGFSTGSSGEDLFSQDNLIWLMQSKKLMSRALFREVPNTGETLLNLYLREQNMPKLWEKNPHLKKQYPFPNDIKKITPVQDSLLGELCTGLTKGTINIDQPDKKLNLFKVATTFTDPVFACYLTKYLVYESSAFYIETKVSSARKNLTMLQHEADSLQGLLSRSIIAAASNADRTFNLNPALQIQRVPIQRSQIDAAVTQAAYTEVVKNLEIAKITLEKEYPIYQLLDEPSLPLRVYKMSTMLGLAAGGIAFGGLIIMYLTIKLLIEEVLNSE